MARALARWSPLSLLLSFSLAACGGGNTDRLEELGEPGRHAVGYRSYDFEYTPPGAAEPRRLEAAVWYPTDVTEGRAPSYFLFPAENVVLNAPPKDLGPLPVLVFSHGHQGYAENSGFLMEHFASHGFVVVAPTHTGNTFDDGEFRDTSIYYLRGHDVSAALDFMRALPADDPLAGAFGEPVALAGHSFGGYTAYGVGGATFDLAGLDARCEGFVDSGNGGPCTSLTDEARARFSEGTHDPRFGVVISMAAGDFPMFGAAGVAAVQVPVLQMTAEDDGYPANAPEQDDYWMALDGPHDRRVNVVGGTHNTFTDACAIGLGGVDPRLPCSDTLTTDEEFRTVGPTRWPSSGATSSATRRWTRSSTASERSTRRPSSSAPPEAPAPFGVDLREGPR